MTWYHGSKQALAVLKKQQAVAPSGRPNEEALAAIYFTPSFAFALACAARPPGMTEMDLDAGTIHFGNRAQFDPEQVVYVYLIDPDRIPADAVVWVDDLQVAVAMDEVIPDTVEVHRASDVFAHFREV